LKEAQSSIDGYVEEKKVVIRENRPLFPHPELKVTLSSVADIEPKPQEVIEQITEETPISVADDTVTNHIETPKEVSKEEKPTPKPTTTAKKKKR
jgi:hypothetical protein